METPPPPDVEPGALGAVLSREWAIPVDRLTYLPKGFGSYHWLAGSTYGPAFFVTVDDLDTKPWLGGQRDVVFGNLQAAYDSARALREEAGLRFVVAPLPTLGGTSTVRHAHGYSLAVFPFVAGEVGGWGEPLGRTDRDELLRHLAELHRSDIRVPALTSTPGALAGRTALERALEELDEPWTGGPYSDTARVELAAHADVVRELLATFDHLAARVTSRRRAPVITHGEPHPGNIIRSDGGVRLIDWDTVAPSGPERDLWMLDDGSTGCFDAYIEAGGTTVDTEAITLYRLTWALADIAAFTAQLRSPHGRNRGTAKAWEGLRGLLDLVPPMPYGPVTDGHT